MKKILLGFSIFLITITGFPVVAKEKEKEKKEETTPEAKKYDDVITEKAISSEGLFDLHKIKSTLYFEIPLDLLGKEMLISSKVSEISNNKDAIIMAGLMPNAPLLIDWSIDGDKVYLNSVSTSNIYGEGESISDGFKKNNLNPIYKSFPIQCYNDDSTAVVIDVTAYFSSDEKPLSPFLYASKWDGMFGVKREQGVLNKDISKITDFKSFPENILIETLLSFKIGENPFTAKTAISVVLLSEEPMQPRLNDRRVGYFSNFKKYYTTKSDYVEMLGYMNRWKMEAKDEDIEKHKNGELVVPKKPIIFYIDPSFPLEWREYIKEGVEDWQIAFEKIGFKDAIIAADYPENDLNFNPDDIRYSCIRYSPSDFANAMGPSWTDPRSGEIIQATVCIYHNVLSLLHNWRFVQTATIDPKARAKFQEMNVKGDLLRYLIAHEVGHTLGLMHNMRGSYAYPVDSLRSPSFTKEYGTTASIMDYARYNYVAQPGDGVTYLLPPRMGLYDIYAIEVGYAVNYDIKCPFEDRKIIREWITEKQDDPIYKFGEQAMGSIDPAGQSESLGDDAVKASEYGIRNLKLIIENLLEWTQAEEGSDYSYTQNMYKEVLNQFKLYMVHCVTYLGGMYQNLAVTGDGQKYFVPVSREKQKEATEFVLRQLIDLSSWARDTDLLTQIPYQTDYVAEFQLGAFKDLLSDNILGRLESTAKVSKDPYFQEEYLTDIYNIIWENTIEDKNISNDEKILQYAFIQNMLTGIEVLPFDKSVYQPGALKMFLKSNDLDSKKQMNTNTTESDVKIYSKYKFYTQLQKAKKLLTKKAKSAKGETKMHYEYLLFEINKYI